MIVFGAGAWIENKSLGGGQGNSLFDLFSSCLSWLRERSDIGKLVPVIVEELRRSGETILPEELDRARAQYHAGLVMSAESPASRASQIARQLLLFGRPIPAPTGDDSAG